MFRALPAILFEPGGIYGTQPGGKTQRWHSQILNRRSTRRRTRRRVGWRAKKVAKGEKTEEGEKENTSQAAKAGQRTAKEVLIVGLLGAFSNTVG